MATAETELSTEVHDGEHSLAEPVNPTEARNRAVAELLSPAYARASTLELTDAESKGLAAPFPDEAFRLGAGGNPDLLYIEHAYLRERLNNVLGIGAAVPVRRREWSEKFSYEFFDKYKKQKVTKEAVRVYVDSVLLVRGCVVGEAVGDATYYLSNDASNFSDALESAKSNAFRRCCKEFGVGLQVWKKGFVEGWKHRASNPGERPEKPNGLEKKSPEQMTKDLGDHFEGKRPENGREGEVDGWMVWLAQWGQKTCLATQPEQLDRMEQYVTALFEQDPDKPRTYLDQAMAFIVKRRRELDAPAKTPDDTTQLFDEQGLPINEPATA